MRKDVQAEPVKHTHFMRSVFIKFTLVLGVFLVGFVPMWLKSRDSVSRLAEAERLISKAIL